jgi:hypothetical protein
MTQEDLLAAILDFVKKHEGVASASRIDGEDAIGVELTEGDEYFVEVHPA